MYLHRMKIEKSFRELKSILILQLDTIMNKLKFYLDQMIDLMSLTFAITVLVGQVIRDVCYAVLLPDLIDLRNIPKIPKTHVGTRSPVFLFYLGKNDV